MCGHNPSIDFLKGMIIKIYHRYPICGVGSDPVLMRKCVYEWKRRSRIWNSVGSVDDDHGTLFKCRYSRSKWLYLDRKSTVPLEVYSDALKENKNITHITFCNMESDFDVNRFLRDLPWVTSISPDRSVSIPVVGHDLLFIGSITLNEFAEEIKLDPSSTYIFSDAGFFASYSVKLGGNAKVLISFVAPTSGKSLTLRVKRSESVV